MIVNVNILEGELLQDVAWSADSFHAKGTLNLLSLGRHSRLGKAIFQHVCLGKTSPLFGT